MTMPTEMTPLVWKKPEENKILSQPFPLSPRFQSFKKSISEIEKQFKDLFKINDFCFDDYLNAYSAKKKIESLRTQITKNSDVDSDQELMVLLNARLDSIDIIFQRIAVNQAKKENR